MGSKFRLFDLKKNPRWLNRALTYCSVINQHGGDVQIFTERNSPLLKFRLPVSPQSRTERLVEGAGIRKETSGQKNVTDKPVKKKKEKKEQLLFGFL